MTRPPSPDAGNAAPHAPVKTVEPAFWRIRPAPADALPIVVDSPHSGTEHPDDFGSVLDAAARHYAEDPFVDRLYASAIAVGRIRAAIMSLLLIHAICRTHPAHPVPSAEAARDVAS